MNIESRDLIVLGSGPGGYVAAIRASQLGRKVTIVERESLGGVCLNWGCIPSKALLRSAQLYGDFKHAAEFGFEIGDVKINFPRIIERSRDVAGKLSSGVNFLMRKNKIEVLKGNGTIGKNNQLHLEDPSGKTSSYSFNDIIIATGAKPRALPGIEVDGEVIHTSRTILEYRRLPQKLLVVGAGAIGIEFAYFFSSLGAQVTVVEMLDQILPPEDGDVSKELTKILTKSGITIHTGAATEDLQRSGKTVTATIKTKKAEEKWSGDCCLLAIGVKPNTDEIGLEELGIELEHGFIKTDEFMRTNVPHHYAIGDVTGKMLLAHKATHEGLVAAGCAAGQTQHPMRYDNIPACTYCQPQVASVGLTEQAAREQGLDYKTAKVPYSANGKALAIGEPQGFIKVIIDDQTGEVLGVHILHAEATELIAEVAAVRSHEGIAASVVDTIHPHPTLSESVMEALALALGRPINC